MTPEMGQAIRDELARVLASHEFRSSKRSQEFLRYVVERAMEGDTDSLKERTIGIEVFGRPASYDPSDDATVRVKAGEVRKRLGLYYASQGVHDALRIELPAGTYVPEFHPCDAAPSEAPAAESVPVVEPVPETTPRGLPRALRIGLAAALIVVAVAAFVWMRLRAPETALDQFWAPVLEGNQPVNLCAAFVPVYSLDPNTTSKPPKIEEFAYLSDQFVGGGDLIGISRLTAMLTRMRRPYQVKVGNAVSFNDLRSAPTVLVGYSYTHWREISAQMRYFIDGSRHPVMITDNGVATKWGLPNLPADRHTDHDYAIVSRVFHPDTHAMLVEVAGITQYGTDAGTDLITNADLMAEALRNAPGDWRKKNIQFVIHVKVIGGVPTTPRVVAAYYW